MTESQNPKLKPSVEEKHGDYVPEVTCNTNGNSALQAFPFDTKPATVLIDSVNKQDPDTDAAAVSQFKVQL